MPELCPFPQEPSQLGPFYFQCNRRNSLKKEKLANVSTLASFISRLKIPCPPRRTCVFPSTRRAYPACPEVAAAIRRERLAAGRRGGLGINFFPAGHVVHLHSPTKGMSSHRRATSAATT